MPRSATFGAGLLVAAMLAACGGTGHASSSSTAATTSTSPATTSTSPATTSTSPATTSTSPATTSTSPATTSTSAATTTSTVSAGPTTTTPTTTKQPPEVPKGRRSQHSKGATPSSGVSIPAAFIIHTGGSLLPPLISVPTGITVQLRLFNQDSKPHTVTLAAPGHLTLHLKPQGNATEDVTGLRKGTYRLLLDGRPEAQMLVGAVPGP